MRIKHLIILMVLLLALISAASPAHAEGVVTVCDEAHLLAALGGGGTVTFSCSGTITLTNTIMIPTDTTIDGAGQDVTISGNNTVRVFTVNAGVTLNLIRLTVANGYDGDYYRAGGIYNYMGTVIITDSTISDNESNTGGIYNQLGSLIIDTCVFSGNAGSLYGGGIHNIAGTVEVRNSNFVSNSAGASGGGIWNEFGVLVVNNCTFSDNRAERGTVGAFGGGITNYDGTLTVTNSTFDGNIAVYGGGGAILNTFGELATVSNCTFSGNQASKGAGIYNESSGVMSLTSSTFSGNSTIYEGGGIYNVPGGVITVTNTIVANGPAGGNCFGTIIDGGGNLSYPDATCPGINLNPLLYPLQDNGGPTWTMALGPGSGALDTGDDGACSADPVNNRDQRGHVRPKDSHCDIGAIEQDPYRKTWLPAALRN